MEIPINNNYQWHKFFPNSGFFFYLLDLVNFVNIFDVVFVGYVHARPVQPLSKLSRRLRSQQIKKKNLIKQDPQIIKRETHRARETKLH
jgi:hypothetical protein